jgi:hypothetical protein
MHALRYSLTILLVFYFDKPSTTVDSGVHYSTVYKCEPDENILKLYQFSDVTIDRTISKWTCIYYNIKYTRTVPTSIPIKLNSRKHTYLLLLVCGDVALNPGPIQNPCGVCKKPIARTHRAIYCDTCYCWNHMKCAELSASAFALLGQSEDPWICKTCLKCPFSDSYFETSFSSTCTHQSEPDVISPFEEISI